MNTKRNIFLWVLYDFANSLVSVVFFLYFAQWVVIEKNVSDLSFNLTFTFSTILLILTTPYIGVLLDKHWRCIVGLRYSTIITVLLYGACAVSAVYGEAIISLVFFTLATYFYQLAFNFYTPLINSIATDKNKGRVSGYGIAGNYAGQLVGLLVALPFSNGSFSFFNASPRAETLLPSVILFFICSLPMLLWFKEHHHGRVELEFKSYTRELFHKTKKLLAYSGVGMFILAYFFFNDAILTTATNFSIFLEQVWAVSDTIKTFVLLGIIVTSAIGGVIAGHIADRFGHKNTMVVLLCGWVVILPFIGFLTNFTMFIVATTLMGFWYGANWAVSRSVMAYLTPSESNSLAFSYFNLIERTSTLVGPVVWGLIVSNMVYLGSYRYRVAVLAVTTFILLGLWCLLKVKNDRAK